MDVSKIIRGIVNSRGYTITSAITQWDYGYVFVPEFEDLPATYRLDFSNDEHHGTALPVYCGSEGGEVPEELIDTGKDIFVWFFYIGDGFGKSEYKWRIPNKCKPKTEQDEPSPTQQSSIDQLIVRSNDAVTSAEQSASAAGQSAQNASQDADRAEDARDNAQTYANNAQTSATQASTSASQASASATASANSASQSAQIKADVEELVDDAQASATASAESASASANSASQASGYAQSASASANSASGYASQADISANTASNKASEASTSAQTASNKASEASQSASQALSYKTDAESAKTASQTAQGLAESARDTAVQAKTDAESAKADAESARDEAQQAVASISGALDDKAPVITDTASGAIASFSDGADDLPLKSLVVDINPVQDLHGQDAPYPAGGGKNILPFASVETDIRYGITWTKNNDGSITISGTATQNAPLYFVDFKLPAGDYLFSNTGSTAAISGASADFYIRDLDNALTLSWIRIGVTYDSRPFTLSTETNVRFYAVVQVNATVSGTIYPMIRLASVADATYAPYENLCPISGWTEVNVNHSGADMTNPTTITIDLGQTVYGGKLDVLSGELTVDRAMVDLGTLSWTYRASNLSMESALSNVKSGTNIPAICSAYKNNTTATGWASLVNGEFTIRNRTLRIRDEAYSDTSAFTNAVTGQTLVYELATPITIQLTPNQVNSLLGVNNIWADSGDTEVEYRADTKLYISKKIAEAIASLT